MNPQEHVAAGADQAAEAAAAAEGAGAGGDLPGGKWPALQRPRVKRRRKAKPEVVMRSVSSTYLRQQQLLASLVLLMQFEELAELSHCGHISFPRDSCHACDARTCSSSLAAS